MPWLAGLIISAVSNVDNLGAGVALGIRRTRVNPLANLIVAGMTTATTAAAVTCGHVISKLLPAVTGWLGPLIIMMIGIATIRTPARTAGTPYCANGPWGERCHPPEVDGVISTREAIILGIALSVNNLGTGLGAGASDVPVLATTVAAGVLSLACVGGGSQFGRAFGRLVLGRHAPLVAGMLLLAVGAAMLPSVR